MTAIPTVSDHALVRYLERVMGLDVESVRRQIAQQCKGIAQARSIHCQGFVYHLRHDTDEGSIVTTVRPNRHRNPRRVPRDVRHETFSGHADAGEP